MSSDVWTWADDIYLSYLWFYLFRDSLIDDYKRGRISAYECVRLIRAYGRSLQE